MRRVRAGDLQIGDVIQDMETTRKPDPDGASSVVRVESWCAPKLEGEIAFRYVVVEQSKAYGETDWASYSPDAMLTLFDQGAHGG